MIGWRCVGSTRLQPATRVPSSGRHPASSRVRTAADAATAASERRPERAAFSGVLGFMMALPLIRLFDDEAVAALETAVGHDGSPPVDSVEMAEERGLELGGRREAVVGPYQLLARGRSHHDRGDDHDELGLVANEILTAEQGPEHWH